MNSKAFYCLVTLLLALGIAVPNLQAAEKPNILVIWGDDVGYWNVSAYNQGMMGYQTPNIDSVAQEGALFTDWYAQQSCTAGRAAFILGQHPFRTGYTPQAPWIYERAVRQESPWGPGQTSADCPRFR